MKRETWYAYIESVGPTQNQLGRAHAEMLRLGVIDRGERLALAAVLLDLEALDSFTSLTQGQAGKLVNVLERTTTHAALPDVTAPAVDEDQDDEHDNGKPMTLGEALTRQHQGVKPWRSR